MIGNVTPEGTRNTYSFSYTLSVVSLYLTEIIKSSYEQEHPLALFFQDHYQGSHRKKLWENRFGFLQ